MMDAKRVGTEPPEGDALTGILCAPGVTPFESDWRERLAAELARPIEAPVYYLHPDDWQAVLDSLPTHEERHPAALWADGTPDGCGHPDCAS